MEWNLVRFRRPTVLVTCSLCLRVRRGSNWLDAEDVIRELRSYDRPDLPRLQSAVCDDCADAILGRRARADETIAA